MPYEPPFSWHGKRARPEKPEPVVVLSQCVRCEDSFEFIVRIDSQTTFCYPCAVLTLREYIMRKKDVEELDGGPHETR